MADVCGIENVIWICELRRDVVEHVSYTQALEGEAGQEGEGFTRILKSSRRRTDSVPYATYRSQVHSSSLSNDIFVPDGPAAGVR